MKIRLPKSDEIDETQKLMNQFYFMYKKALIEYIKSFCVFIAEEDDTIVGIILYNKKRNKILLLVIKKEYRRKNIGKKLFETSRTILNLKKIKILAVEESINFWQSIGFYKTNKFEKTKHKILTEMEWGI